MLQKGRSAIGEFFFLVTHTDDPTTAINGRYQHGLTGSLLIMKQAANNKTCLECDQPFRKMID